MKKKNVFLVILATSLSLAACSVVNSDSSTSIKDSSTISHSFSYDNSNYSPSFKRFDEIAYYSYTKPKNKNNSIKPKKKIVDKTNEERQDYVDEEGRTHYPIPYSDTYFFSDFLFFEFDSDNSEFLESRIGNGHIFGLVVKTNIFNFGIDIPLSGKSGDAQHHMNIIFETPGDQLIQLLKLRDIDGVDIIWVRQKAEAV